MKSLSGKNSDWYVGTAANPRQRLFGEHCVKEQGGAWIFRKAHTSDIARSVERAYLDAGCDGGPSGGDEDSVYVYAYQKTGTTIQ